MDATAKHDPAGVFLCYSHADAAPVGDDIAFLKSRGASLWYDVDITGGTNWRAQIGAAIDRVTHVLFFVSSRSVASEHCNREINYALDQNKTVVPIRLDATPFTADLRLGLGRVHTITRTDVPESIYRNQLLAALGLAGATNVVSPPPTSHLRRNILAALVIAAVAVGGVLAWRTLHIAPADQQVEAAQSIADRSIVVLPFVNMSADPEQTFFSDGLAEELMNVLSQNPELKVISRTSAFSFKGRQIDTPTIAQRLGVAHVLEGSVRLAGDRIRITVQLIDARTDTHLFSETFDRTLDDVFAIQDEIAVHVAQRLNATLSAPGSTRATIDPQAYLLFLRARHLINQATFGDDERATAMLRQALEIDPTYVRAWTELARVYAHTDGNLATQAMARAVALDPGDAVVNAFRGWGALLLGDLTDAARLYERATRLDSANIDVLRGLAVLLLVLDRVDDAVALNQWLALRDPLCIVCQLNLAQSYLLADRRDDAIDTYARILQIDPESFAGKLWLAGALLLTGEAQRALDLVNSVAIENPNRTWLRILALYKLGDIERAQTEFAEFEARDGNANPNLVAMFYAFTGNADLAFAWLDRSAGGPLLFPRQRDPFLVSLHGDRRWPEFLKRTGVAPAQLAAIEFNPVLPK